MESANQEIRARGEEPVALSVQPSGAEIAQPSRSSLTEGEANKEPDPDGKIERDSAQWITARATVVPGSIQPGESVRVHVQWEPKKLAHWNNEAEPSQVWLDLPDGWSAEKRLFELPLPAEPESSEVRKLEFELKTPSDAKDTTISIYSLYYVCEDRGGTCMFRRHDLAITIRITDSAAPFSR